MKLLQFFIICVILFSCKKENIYYYADKKPIQDSTVIRFVDEELEKLKINTAEKDLKIYTTLYSTSYKTDLDSIRNETFNKSLEYSLKPEDRQAFNEWFREKIIIVDNRTGNVVSFYSSFKNKKNDRDGVYFLGLRKWIVLATKVYDNPEIKTPVAPTTAITASPIYDLKLKNKELRFLSKIKISDESIASDYFSFLDAIKIFQILNETTVKEPNVIKEIFDNDKLIYSHKAFSRNIFTANSIDLIKQYLLKVEDAQSQKNCIYFGSNSDYYMFIHDRNYTYLIYNFSAVITDREKKRIRHIPPILMKETGIKYYNAVKK